MRFLEGAGEAGFITVAAPYLGTWRGAALASTAALVVVVGGGGQTVP
jgi:hypothetical protein